MFCNLCSRRLIRQLPNLLPRFLSYVGDRVAVVDAHGPHTYSELSARADSLRSRLLRDLPTSVDGLAPRIALLCPRDVSFVVSLLASLSAGAGIVPLSLSHPPRELAYFVRDSRASLVLCSTELGPAGRELADELQGEVPVVPVTSDDALRNFRRKEEKFETLLSLQGDDLATVVHTSGTTGPPKGVLVSRAQLAARISAMVKAWDWSDTDVIINCLPLHHVHGLENCLLTPLSVGATVLLLPPGPRFNPAATWKEMESHWRPNVFMAVPTMLAKLAAGRKGEEEATRRMCERFRLMVSGSAPLPDAVLHQWRNLTGHTLLERYGMSELGMALTNPLTGPRLSGHVGQPMPGVEARIVKPSEDSEVLCRGTSSHTEVFASSTPVGDLQIRGSNVFTGYFGRPEATAAAFTPDGWFRTGDTAEFNVDEGSYRILGRSSVDIIKTGGHKVSALDVERRLMEHEAVSAVTVLGMEDDVYGQRIVAVVVGKVEEEGLRKWARERMPGYEVPTRVKIVEEIPTNAMGKVDKKGLIREFDSL